MRVVIVGAGISGLFVAYTLARRGVRDVIVLERKYVGYGSTGRCATGIRASFTSDVHINLMRESIRLWIEYSRGELGKYGLQFIQSGYVWLARRPETLDKFRKLITLHNRFGVPTRIIGGDELAELLPQLNTKAVVGAMYDPMAGKSYVFTTLHALLRACRHLGVRVITGVEVVKLVQHRDRIAALETSEGRLEGDVFVVAAGSETRKLLQTVGIEVPVRNMPRHILVTEAYQEAFKPLVIDWDTPGAPYIVQTIRGNFIIGREIEEEPEQPLYSQRIDFMPRAVRPFAELFPFLKLVRVLRYWVGYYVVTPDNHPIYGPVESFSNLFLAVGFSGHGYMMGPVTGKIIADWILDGRPSILEAERLTLERFERGALVREQAVVG